MKSAIGEKLTRKDHGDVSNQMYSMVSFAPNLTALPARMRPDKLTGVTLYSTLSAKTPLL